MVWQLFLLIYIILVDNINITWYLQFHFLCDKLWMSFRLIWTSSFCLLMQLADRAFIIAKGAFIFASSTQSFRNHLPSECFSWHKKNPDANASGSMAAPVRLDLTTLGLTVRCSTDWAKGQYWVFKQATPHRNLPVWCSVSGDPCGNRTHVNGVRGRCLNRLTNGPFSKRREPAPTYFSGTSPSKYLRHKRA